MIMRRAHAVLLAALSSLCATLLVAGCCCPMGGRPPLFPALLSTSTPTARPTRTPTLVGAPATRTPTQPAVPPTRTPTQPAVPPTRTPTQPAVPPTRTPTAVTPGPAAFTRPTFVYPVDGQTLDWEGAYLFKVEPVPGAEGYLWGFFQNGQYVWENNRDEGRLSGADYGILENSDAHRRFQVGDVQVMVRVMAGGVWSEATQITIHLRPR